jgi:integrase
MADEKQKRAKRGSKQIYTPVDEKKKPRKDEAGNLIYYGRFTGAKHADEGGRQLPRKRWDIPLKFYADEEGKPRPVTKDNHAVIAYEQAKAREKATGSPFESATVIKSVGPTVRQLADQFEREAQPIKVAPAYVEEYRRVFGSDYRCNVDKYLGEKIASEVKRSDVVKMIAASIKDGRSPRSILRGRSALSVLYGWALDNDLIDGSNPTTDVECPEYIPTKEVYTTGEVAAMLRVADGTLLGRLIAFHYFTGARPGEMAGLRWGDVDFAAQTVTIRRSREKPYTKTKRIKVVALHPVVRDMLGRLAGDDDALVFTRNGKMLPKCDHKGSCWGLRDLTEMTLGFSPKQQPWYSFRRTHATALDDQLNAAPSDLMRALGHRTMQQSLEYSQADGRNTRALVSKLPDPRVLVPTPDVGRN